MLVLSNTTDAIEVVLGGAVTTNQLQCVATWRDVTTTTLTPGRTRINTNNTTDVDIVTGPGAGSTYRIIDYMSVYNKDTVSATVTLKYDENGTEAILTKVTLLAGEKIEFVDGVGFRVLAINGAVKERWNHCTEAITDGISTVVLTSDQTNNNAVANTIADVTGLSVAVTANQGYWFRFTIWYTSAATSTGSRWAINGPAITSLYYRSEYSLTTTSRTYNEGMTAYDNPSASNATSAATGSNVAIVEGYLKPSANGTLIARFASEVSSSAIVAKTGSILRYKAI